MLTVIHRSSNGTETVHRWTVGEPDISNYHIWYLGVEMATAIGPELEYILSRFDNLPYVDPVQNDWNEQVWYGDLAKFIVANIA